MDILEHKKRMKWLVAKLLVGIVGILFLVLSLLFKEYPYFIETRTAIFLAISLICLYMSELARQGEILEEMKKDD